MMAQVLRKIPPINKMMITGREASARRPSATEDVLDAMTQYGLRSQEKLLSSLEDDKQRGQPRVIASGDHVARGRLGRSQVTAETKGELSREDVHDILQGYARPTRGWARSCRLSERVARRTTLQQRPQGNASGGLASVHDYKIKDKKKARPSNRRKCI